MNEETVEIQNKEGIQAIQLPENFKINDNKVYLKKIGEIIYLIPYHSPWKNFYESLGTFSEDFMDQRDQGDEQQRESFE